MGAITNSYLSITRGWVEGGPAHKDRKVLKVVITVPKADATAYGDGTNTIPAAFFGMTVIEEVRGFIDGALAIVEARATPTGSLVYTYDLTNATDATRNVVAGMIKRIDSSNDGVFYGTVIGY